MGKGRIQQVIDSMDPVVAGKEMAVAAKKLFSILGEEALRDFLKNLLEDGGQDKIAGLVQL